jgi:hypothetical protein
MAKPWPRKLNNLIRNKVKQNKKSTTKNQVILENADPITTTSGIPRVIPILEMMGSKMMAATVCDTNVATTPQKINIITNDCHRLSNGRAVKEKKHHKYKFSIASATRGGWQTSGDRRGDEHQQAATSHCFTQNIPATNEA